MNNSAAQSDQLQEEARAWVRRLTTTEVKPWDAQGFQRWLRTSPAHRDAFNEAKRVWKTMQPAAGDLLRTEPSIAQAHLRAVQGQRRLPGRRAFLGAAGSAAALAGMAAIYPPFGLWPSARTWQADFRTDTGQQRTLTLADSVRVTLNTRTSARQHTQGGATVGLDLLDGEAAIDLGASGHAFDVAAGAGRSMAEAARFEVRYLGGTVRVSCLEGYVRVEHPAGSRVLQACEQTVYDSDSISGVAGVQPDDISAWRKGQLVFRQARLVDVIEEINRYRTGRVMLMNDAARNREISGRFNIASLDSALWQIQHTYKLDGRKLPGGLLILS